MFSVVLFSCADDNDLTTTNPDNNQGNTRDPIDADELATTIRNGLITTANNIESTNKRHVRSEYEIILNTINVTVVYEANYDDVQNENSEILLKVYNNYEAKNTSFFYYKDGKLYYEFAGNKNYVPDFNYSGTFQIFYNFIRLFDIGSYLFGNPDIFESNDEFIKEEDDTGLDSFSNYVKAIITSAEPDSLAMYGTTDEHKNIRIQNVSLDKIKEPVNDFLTSYVKGYIGTKIDVISLVLLGFKASDLGNVGIGIINANTLEFAIRNNAITDINIILDGVLTDNINSFKISVQYSMSNSTDAIILDPADDPATNAILTGASEDNDGYWLTNAGEYHYKGTLYVDILDETFDAEFLAKLSFGNNLDNEFLLDIRKKTINTDPNIGTVLNKEMASIYYNYLDDELLYISLEGFIQDYLGGGIALTEMGFPKAKLSGFNLTKELGYYLTVILEQLSYNITLGDILGAIGGVEEITERLHMFISKSRTIGTSYYELTMDNEFFSVMLGNYQTSFLDRLSEYVGIETETLKAILGLGIADDIKLILGFDYLTGEINISLYNGNTRFFVFSMYNQRIRTAEFIVTPPKDFNPGDYNEFKAAETVHVHAEGLVYMQGSSETDLSKLVGLIIGDETGLNSPFSLTINDKLYISVDVWSANGIDYISATVWLNPVLKSTYTGGVLQFTVEDIDENDVPIIKIYTSLSDPDYFLIELKDLNFSRGVLQNPVKYKASRAGLYEVFSQMRGDSNIFTSDNYNEAYDILTRDATVELNNEWIVLRLSPYNLDGILYDPIYDILGVANMNAAIKVKISFTMPQGLFSADESIYVLPEIDDLEDLSFDSIYVAKWHESAMVRFGDETYEFVLSFNDESSIIVDGTYLYYPTARLFGQDVSYFMLITNKDIGTKRITGLAVDSLELDPTLLSPIPTEIEVYYDDPLESKRGKIAFIIEDFPYSAESIRSWTTGVEATYYTIVIGLGSIAESRFALPIEILNRDFKVDEYIGDVPIVGVATIDPYDYSTKKAFNSDYNPLSEFNTIILKFGSNKKGSTAIANEAREFNWQLTSEEESTISYHGGRFFVYDYYNDTRVALEVIVLAKEIDYIQIIHFENGTELYELPGEYTIDAIDLSTYTIPIVSTDEIQIRIYFKTSSYDILAKYRIIGSSSKNFSIDEEYFDGYYNIDDFKFKWAFDKATATLISLDGTVNTLSKATNIDTALFTDSLVGSQTVNLLVRAPSRRVQLVADSTLAYTQLTIDESGNINTNDIEEMVRQAAVGYGAIGSDTDNDGEFIIANPLESSDKNRLPKTINFDMSFAGGIVRKSYLVTWDVHPMTGGADNTEIINMLQKDSKISLTGKIGDVEGKIQTITVIIHNTNGTYKDLKIFNEDNSLLTWDGDYYQTTIDPYNPQALPVKLMITYEIDGIDISDEYTIGGTGDNASGPWKYEGKEITDNTFGVNADQYLLSTEVPGSRERGRLPQDITIRVNILDMTITTGFIYGLRDDDNNISSNINTYSLESASILKKLQSTDTRIGVQYQNKDVPNSGIVIPVEWTNADEVISALKGYENKSVLLTGIIYKGTSLQQTVSMGLNIVAPAIKSIAFNDLSELTSSVGTSEAALEVNTLIKDGTGEITFKINKPYALVNAGGGRYLMNDNDKDSLILYNFLTQSLSNIFVTFEDNSTGYYGAVYGNINGIDSKVFTELTDKDTSTFEISISQLGVGSASISIEMSVIVLKDVLSANGVGIAVEVFGDTGQLIYENEPYYLPSSITVSYRSSGSVIYSDIVWKTTGTASTIVKQDENGQYISSEYFFSTTSFTGQRVVVSYDILPQSETISLNIDFLSKNINTYNYSAVAAVDASQYTIRDGVMTIDNIYSFGQFDSTKLPSTIIPRNTANSDGFQISGDSIKFISNWLPMTQYAVGDTLEFNTAVIMQAINNMFDPKQGSPTEIVIAWMRLIMYNGRTQDIQLKLKVDILEDPAVSRDDTYFESGNKTYLNLYEYNGNGVFNLQYPLTVTFTNKSSKTTKSYTFEENELIFQIQRSNGNYYTINQITFDYMGHTLGQENYGNKNSELLIRAYYNLGSEYREIAAFSVTIQDSTLEHVEITNYGYSGEEAATEALIINTYYVDPYDDRTFALPSKIRAVFKTKLTTDNLTVNFQSMSGDTPFENFIFSETKYWSDPTKYAGKSYELTSDLSSYGGGIIQEFKITIVILDRSVEIKDNNEYKIDDPFQYIISDLPDFDEIFEFTNNLEEGLFKLYYESGLSPAPLKIEWQTISGSRGTSDGGTFEYDNSPITDDAFTFEGFNLNVVGVVTGATQGGSVTINVSADRWEFIGIAKSTYTSGDPTGQVAELIEFFSDGASKERTFTVIFKVNNEYKTISFTPYDTRFDSDSKRTALIDWQEVKNNELRQVKFYNEYKTESYNIAYADFRYRYSVIQITYTHIDFGYGPQLTGDVVIVLDPFNPVVPNRVSVQGFHLGDNLQEEIGVQPISFGVAYVIWPAEVYQMPMNGGIKNITITVCTELGLDGKVKPDTYSQEFVVKVYYLDRRPTSIQRENTAASGTVTYTTLFTRDPSQADGKYSFEIDPISYAYNSATGMYNMPENLIVTFNTTYDEGDPRALAIITMGSEFRIKGAKWIYPDIPLSGTYTLSPQYIVLAYDTTYANLFEIAQKTSGVYGDYSKPDYETANTYGTLGITQYFDLRITVIDRSIEATNISEIRKSDGYNSKEYHYATIAIDPYNIEFPQTVIVKFKDASGGAVEHTFQNVIWEYDATHIIRPDVISGALELGMQVMARMRVYGAILSIQFPIKARNIDTTFKIEDGDTVLETTNPIRGGTIYVLKGFPVEPQLPTYIYYQFDYQGVIEYTSVPIVWNLGATINTDSTGEYRNVSASLGTVNKNNIVFNIEVIDPIVYCLRGSGDSLVSGGFIYNNIVIAVAGDNSYFSGQESVILPGQIFINTAQQYITVDQITYNISTGMAIFNCSYDFLVAGNADTTDLRGTDGLTKLLYITFEVPITTYNSSSVVSTYGFPDGEAYKHFPLGIPILATDMPKVPISDGSTSQLSELDVIWDFSTVNIYKAGNYKVVGYYKTAYGNNISVDFTIIIDKDQISDSQFLISESWTYRTYSGSPVPLINGDNLTVGLFLRDDGTFNSNVDYIFEYLVSGVWTTNQPLNVGKYYVRIRVEDYNYDSSSTTTPVEFEIGQQSVDLYLVTYSVQGIVGTYYNNETIVITYDGLQHNNIVISGLPLSDATFECYIRYYRINEVEETIPQDVGQYYMTITIVEDGSNYLVTQGYSLRINLTILLKQVTYIPPSTATYTGSLITSLPVTSDSISAEELSRLQITYRFYNSSYQQIDGVLDVGTYYYTLIIDGGGNYSSGQFGFDYYETLTIVKREIQIKLKSLSSEYLAPIQDLKLAIGFIDVSTGQEFELSQLSERDKNALLSSITVSVVGGISDKHLVGQYELTASYFNNLLTNYDIKLVQGNYYNIGATEAILINNASELKEVLNSVDNGSTYKFYLSPGSYGDIIINRVTLGSQVYNRNASVTLIGAYDVNAGTSHNNIAVSFRSITVYSGAVTIDIMKAEALPIAAGAPGVEIMIKAAASDVTVSRSYFYRNSSSTNFIASSTAIMSEANYKGTVYITNGTLITGHSSGAVLYGGSLVVSDSEISDNINGVQINGNTVSQDEIRHAQSIIIIDSVFSYNKSVAISVLCLVDQEGINFSITGNQFVANVLAIKTLEYLEIALLMTQNTLYLNGADLVLL
jgi:hypothetical protein